MEVNWKSIDIRGLAGWNDPQSLEQAIMVVRKQKIDLEQVRKWAIAESSGDKYKVFANLLKKNRLNSTHSPI